MRLLLMALLMTIGLTSVSRAQSSNPSTQPSNFTNFIANQAPAATTPCSSSDLIPVIQNGLTKRLPCALSSFPSSGSSITQLLALAAGPNTGVTINGDLVLQEDLSHHLSVATGAGIATILFGNGTAPVTLSGPLTLTGPLTVASNAPNPLSPSLPGVATVTISGSLNVTAQTIMNGAVAMLNLPTSGGGRCLGYNVFTHQLYISLASC